MNSSKIVFIVNESARLIQCAYDAQLDREAPKTYLFKTLDQSIKVDDLVVVETNTRHGYTIVKVTEVDVDVDFDDPVELKWAFSPINLDAIVELKQAEQAAIDKVRAIELKKKREALRQAMFADNEETMGQLKLAQSDLPPGE